MPFPVRGDVCCPKHADNRMAKALSKVKKQTRGDIPEVEYAESYNLQNEEEAKIYWRLVGENGSK